MKFPNLVYRSPGSHHAPGGTFDYLQVNDDDELGQAAKDGWFPTVELAVSKPSDFNWEKYGADQGWWAGKQDERAELEKQANELGIKFDGRTTDSALARKIEEALE